MRTRLAAITILGWCLLIPSPLPQAGEQPMGFISSLRAQVKALRFFEGERDPVAHAQRRYDQTFVTNPARYIHWELELAHPAPGRPTSFTVEEVWRGPQGARLRYSRTFTIEGHWTKSWWSGSARLFRTLNTEVPSPFRCKGMLGEWGPCDPVITSSKEYWPLGTYQVELFVDRRPIATGSFNLVRRRR